MTFLLIVAIITLCVSVYQAAGWKKKEIDYRKSTKTNISLQKKLIIKYYNNISGEILEYATLNTTLSNKMVFDYLESLFTKYNLPDFRTHEQKYEDRKKYDACAEEYFTHTVYFSPEGNLEFDHVEDATKANILERISLQHIPFTSDILFGIPDTKVVFNGLTYRYDYRGFIEISNNPMNKLFWTIIQLLAEKELKSQGYKYSYNFKESEWQRREADIQKHEENKKKFPWYFD